MAIDIEAPGANEADLMRALSNLMEHRGFRLERTTNLTTQNYTAGTTDLVFQVATLDSDTFWSAGTPARATVPAAKGITVMDVAASARVESITADTWLGLTIQQYKSSDVFQRSSTTRSEVGVTVAHVNAVMLSCPVAAGDYFVVRLQSESDTDVTVAASGTNLSGKVVGMNPA
jgi:hypothetical protein